MWVDVLYLDRLGGSMGCVWVGRSDRVSWVVSRVDGGSWVVLGSWECPRLCLGRMWGPGLCPGRMGVSKVVFGADGEVQS